MPRTIFPHVHGQLRYVYISSKSPPLVRIMRHESSQRLYTLLLRDPVAWYIKGKREQLQILCAIILHLLLYSLCEKFLIKAAYCNVYSHC
jgi:hypothetical protein